MNEVLNLFRLVVIFELTVLISDLAFVMSAWEKKISLYNNKNANFKIQGKFHEILLITRSHRVINRFVGFSQ
jgi:hypothetical protein